MPSRQSQKAESQMHSPKDRPGQKTAGLSDNAIRIEIASCELGNLFYVTHHLLWNW